MTSNPFSNSYAEARQKFVEAATQAGADLWLYAHPEKGPDGGDLFTDCAWIGPKDAVSVLVLVSGTHGVEGYCGSGAQIDWLRRGEYLLLGPEKAALLVHGINPYGFAWKRRVTHENVDMNRNFIDFSAPLPTNPEYDKLADAVTPIDWSAETQAVSRKTLLDFAVTNGFPALAQAMSGGQYNHPNGIFFGGNSPTWSRLTLEKIFADHLSKAKHIGLVDYHTGLGPEGYAEPIITSPAGSPETLRAMQWHGQAAKCIDAGDSVSADIAGDWLAAAPELVPHAQFTGISLEYGTVDSVQVLDALRADNWLHSHGNPSGTEAQEIKQQIMDAFYVDTDIWRGMVLGQSLMTVRQTINGLNNSAKGN